MIADRNRNFRKKKKLYLLIYSTSACTHIDSPLCQENKNMIKNYTDRLTSHIFIHIAS